MTTPRDAVAGKEPTQEQIAACERACAVLCMDQLGDVRKKGCGHCIRVHAKLADAILAALDGGACA